MNCAPVKITLDFLLHLIRMQSKDMPRKKKKAYRKSELNELVKYIHSHAGNI